MAMGAARVGLLRLLHFLLQDCSPKVVGKVECLASTPKKVVELYRG
jgi:hypothetical protein